MHRTLFTVFAYLSLETTLNIFILFVLKGDNKM